MSEVQRFWSHEASNIRCVREADFDRVTAERDAALRQVETITADRDAEKQMKAKARIQRDVQTAKAADLQERLTAADERADVLEGLLREVQKSARKQDWSSGYPTLFASVDAALKPAEEPRNQCDGCQAGIPVVNGAHRMGKPDGYPDTMSCTAKLYKPASGSTCNQILEESGLPTNYPCKSCGRGACIDR